MSWDRRKGVICFVVEPETEPHDVDAIELINALIARLRHRWVPVIEPLPQSKLASMAAALHQSLPLPP
jgi:hypothetical protein